MEQEIGQLHAIEERLRSSATPKAGERLREVEQELKTAEEAYDEVQRHYTNP